MRILKVLILLSLLPISFLSSAEDKKDKKLADKIKAEMADQEKTSKVEIADPSGLKGPTTQVSSFEELLKISGGEDLRGANCESSLKELPYSAGMAKALEKQQELFKNLPEGYAKIITGFIDFDEKKLDMMLKLVYGKKDSSGEIVKPALKTEQLEALVKKIIPNFQNYRPDLFTDVFLSVQEDPDLFMSELEELTERMSNGDANDEDIELFNRFSPASLH